MDKNDLVIMDIPCEVGNKEIMIKGALGYGPHWTFTGESKFVEFDGEEVEVFQIISLKDVYTVKGGIKGGWVDSEEILSQTNRCWVDEGCVAIGNTRITGTTSITGNIIIKDSIVSDASIDSIKVENKRSIINNSNLYYVILNDLFDVIGARIEHCRFNEFLLSRETHYISIFDGIYKRLSVDGKNIIFDNCELSNLDILVELVKDVESNKVEFHEMKLEGISMETRRPELILGRNFDDRFAGVTYDRFLQLGTYSCNSLSFLLDEDNVSSYLPEYVDTDDLLSYSEYKDTIHVVDRTEEILNDNGEITDDYLQDLASFVSMSFSKPTPSMADLNEEEIKDAEIEDLED